MRTYFRSLIAMSVLAIVVAACGSAEPDAGSATTTSATPPSTMATITTSLPSTTSTTASPESAELAKLYWDDACEQTLTDHLDLVAYLVAAYDHLPPEQYLGTVGLDQSAGDTEEELRAKATDLGCSQIRGTILALDRLDTVEHHNAFGQFIKATQWSPFIGPAGEDVFQLVSLVTGSTPPGGPPAMPPWTEPSSCADAWDAEIAMTDFSTELLAFDPTFPTSEDRNAELDAAVEEHYELIRAAENRFGCDYHAKARYQLEVAASRNAEDFWEALAKAQLVSAAQNIVGQPFVPPLYPEAVARDLNEPALSLLQEATLDEMIARVTVSEIDTPPEYLRVSDLPGEEIGGVILAIPRSHVPIALASDADYEFLAEYNEGLAQWARNNSFIPDGYISTRFVVFIAYHRDNEPYDAVQVAVHPRAWPEEELLEFFEDAKRLEAPAGEFFWDDIEQSADKNFTDHDILLITYLLPVPELNVTYSLDCSSSFPVRDDFYSECERIARTMYPVGRIVPSTGG